MGASPERVPPEPTATAVDSPIILVVDDQAQVRDTIEGLLALDAYRLVFAESGAQAFEALARHTIDLVLCDVVMPTLDGLDVCRMVKAHHQWRFTPVILITALDGADDMVRGLEAGADEFLSKPVDKVVLRARVRAMLRIRRQYRDLSAMASDVDALLRRRRERLIADAGLTDAEREVLGLLLLGRTHQDIAEALGISERTSKLRQTKILEKLGADSRADLLRLFA